MLLLLAIARELTACVKTMAFYLSVSRYVLETTVVPWGNSLGDLVTAVAMVRQGQSTAAATALFAAPLFNVLLSAGVTLMLATGHGHTLTFGYSKMDQVKATGAAILACLLLLVGLLFEKQVGQMGGYGLLSLYLLFVVGVGAATIRCLCGSGGGGRAWRVSGKGLQRQEWLVAVGPRAAGPEATQVKSILRHLAPADGPAGAVAGFIKRSGRKHHRPSSFWGVQCAGRLESRSSYIEEFSAPGLDFP